MKWRLWAAVGLVVASLAATINAYRPLARNGRLSMVAMASSLLTSELPLQVIAGQLGVLAWLSRRLPRPWRWVLWLASAVSWLGLIGLHRHGRRAGVPLTAALEVDVVPTENGAAKTPGLLRMVRIYRDYAHDADISYGPHGARTCWTSGADRISTATARLRCCCRFPVVRGRPVTSVDKPTR